MDKLIAKLEELAYNIKEYLNARIDEIKLEAAEKISTILSNLIAGFIGLLVFIFFLIFANLSAAIALGQWLHNLSLGFLLVALFYLLLGIVVWSARKRLIQIPILNSLIKKLFRTDEDD